MTNEKAIHTLAHYDLSAASDLHEAVNMAIAALRTPPATGAAQREACAAECDALQHDFKIEADDAQRKGLFNQENDYAMRSYGARACAAAIRALPAPEVPDTPAVGEDAGADCECTCASELAEKVRVLLADVARLQKELDGATFREERYAEDAVGARLALEDARAEVARLTEERDNTTKALRRADSMLTAVRKIADDYHDVDVTGDPPREVACNPCANDILNVLEGRKP